MELEKAPVGDSFATRTTGTIAPTGTVRWLSES